MEEDDGPQGTGLALDANNEKLHTFVPGETPAGEPSIEQQAHPGAPDQLNGLPDSLQLIADGQQAHIQSQSDTQMRADAANEGDAAHLIQRSRQPDNQTPHAHHNTLVDGATRQRSIEDGSRQANELQSHSQPQPPQGQPQLQSQHVHLQLFLQNSPVPQLPQHPQLQQLQQQTVIAESRAEQMHTMFASAPPPPPQHEQQPFPQNLLPNFTSTASLESSQPPMKQRESHFSNMKLIPNPPDLQKWREKLFNVEDTIVLSEEEFQTYFPHVDNVYSHRSTQKYKRKPFISHYWDCRLKGRPPGTPKSSDPNKKKRKRVARERNLCDVKIKITEYFPSAMTGSPGLQAGLDAISSAHAAQQQQSQQSLVHTAHGGIPGCAQPFGVLTPSTTLPAGHPGASGRRYYTIQRVNGNGGNGRSDSIGGPHRHTLEESDRVKKNSVQRFLLKEEKERKKAMVSASATPTTLRLNP
ncbi:hypothetical protein VTO42DRAFT_5536 [Malbranchea cinnamomea]